MKRNVAEVIRKLMLEHGAQLNDSVRLVMDNCTPQEFEPCRAAVGQIMGTMLLEIMNPIHDEHPELRPPELNDVG